MVVAKVISKAQNAFVKGRQILDAVLITYEAIDSISKSNDYAILCKLDMEKAMVMLVLLASGYGKYGF